MSSGGLKHLYLTFAVIWFILEYTFICTTRASFLVYSKQTMNCHAFVRYVALQVSTCTPPIVHSG